MLDDLAWAVFITEWATCKIYKEAIESKEPACCVWYMDNVILGDKTVRDCPYYHNS